MIALALAREGVRLAICARTENALREAPREIERETKSEALPVRADVTSLRDLQQLVSETVAHFG